MRDVALSANGTHFFIVAWNRSKVKSAWLEGLYPTYTTARTKKRSIKTQETVFENKIFDKSPVSWYN